MTKNINIIKLIVLCLFSIFFVCSKTMAAGPDYEVRGQYIGSQYGWDSDSKNVNRVTTQEAVNADVSTKSGGPSTGIVSDLCDPYFYENYYDQVYDISYCDWDKIMAEKNSK